MSNNPFRTRDSGEAVAIVLRLEEKGEVNRWPFVKMDGTRWIFEWSDVDGDLHWWHKEYEAGKIGCNDLRNAFQIQRQLLDEARDLKNGKSHEK